MIRISMKETNLNFYKQIFTSINILKQSGAEYNTQRRKKNQSFTTESQKKCVAIIQPTFKFNKIKLVE